MIRIRSPKVFEILHVCPIWKGKLNVFFFRIYIYVYITHIILDRNNKKQFLKRESIEQMIKETGPNGPPGSGGCGTPSLPNTCPSMSSYSSFAGLEASPGGAGVSSGSGRPGSVGYPSPYSVPPSGTHTFFCFLFFYYSVFNLKALSSLSYLLFDLFKQKFVNNKNFFVLFCFQQTSITPNQT